MTTDTRADSGARADSEMDMGIVAHMQAYCEACPDEGTCGAYCPRATAERATLA